MRIAKYLTLWALAALAFCAVIGMFALPAGVSLLAGFVWGIGSTLFAMVRWYA
jgi:hypothetical protein